MTSKCLEKYPISQQAELTSSEDSCAATHFLKLSTELDWPLII